MKKYLFVLLMSIVPMGQALQAQNCKVLLSAINKEYSGDCKKGKAHGNGKAVGLDTYKGSFAKGLPHGNGVYTWSNGNVYTGAFKKGKKEGKGELVYKTEKGKDSIVKGFWKKDKYAGLYEKPYKLLEKTPNITTYQLTKIDDNINALRFSIRENEKTIFDPRISFTVQHGQFQTQLDQTDFVELKGVTFPIMIKMFYKQDYMELEIFEPGLWQIRTDFTFIKGLN